MGDTYETVSPSASMMLATTIVGCSIYIDGARESVVEEAHACWVGNSRCHGSNKQGTRLRAAGSNSVLSVEITEQKCGVEIE